MLVAGLLLAACGTTAAQPTGGSSTPANTSPSDDERSEPEESSSPGDEDEGDDRGDVITVEGVEINDHGTEPIASEAEDDGSVDIELDTDGEENYFSPSILVGSANEKRLLRLENESSVAHNFTYGKISVDVDPHSTETVTVRLPKKGTETFFCAFHAAVGMAGAFRVG